MANEENDFYEEALTEEKPKHKGGLPGYESLSPEEQNKKMIELFRKTFSTKEGKVVFGIILEDLHYFDVCNNEQAQALNNYAKVLISSRMGINNNKSVTDAILSVE